MNECRECLVDVRKESRFEVAKKAENRRRGFPTGGCYRSRWWSVCITLGDDAPLYMLRSGREVEGGIGQRQQQKHRRVRALPSSLFLLLLQPQRIKHRFAWFNFPDVGSVGVRCLARPTTRSSRAPQVTPRLFSFQPREKTRLAKPSWPAGNPRCSPGYVSVASPLNVT